MKHYTFPPDGRVYNYDYEWFNEGSDEPYCKITFYDEEGGKLSSSSPWISYQEDGPELDRAILSEVEEDIYHIRYCHKCDRERKLGPLISRYGGDDD